MVRCRAWLLTVALTCGCAVGTDPVGFNDDVPGGAPVDVPDAGTDLDGSPPPPDADTAMDAPDAPDARLIDGSPDASLDASIDASTDVPSDVAASIDLAATEDLPVALDVVDVTADRGCLDLPGHACTPGATQPCGSCGTQTCTDACAWSACTGGGACAPGAARTQPCGNCGTQTQHCSAACAWEPVGACGGSGPCAPGAEQQGGCDPCSRQVCGASCAWGACGLRPGNACEHRAGTNHRACGACRCGLQFCLATCQWSAACVSCCTTCGGCL